LMIWVSLVSLALLLWRGRFDGEIGATVWEPAVLVLAGFVTFLSLFGWLLFWPERSGAEESPLLFLAGLFTLIPPCVIAWQMMPPGSVLRPWLSAGVLIFGVLTMLSPIPAELFRVPRDRRHWMQLVTDASLSVLDVENPVVTFESLTPATQYRLTSPSPASQPSATISPTAGRSSAVSGSPTRPSGGVEDESADPWSDPFRGTGRRISRAGEASAARRSSALPVERVEQSLAAAPVVPVPAAASAPEPPPVPVPRVLQEQFPAGLDLMALDRSLRDEEQRGFMEESGDDVSGNEEATGGLESEIVSLERTEDEYGGVMVEGIARAVFAAGQKRTNLQIPLSPPFPGIPEAECEPAGHEPLRVRVALRQPYGLRIEVRRSEASQPLEADVSFSAVYTPSRPV
jgi:hypothetical protein